MRITGRARVFALIPLVFILLLGTLVHLSRRPPQHTRPHPPPWLDVAPLMREVNITQMLLDSPGQWDMFQEPTPELYNAPLPQTHACEDSASFGPMLFVGVFSVAGEYRQRAVVRALQTCPSPPSEKVVMKFILGRNPDANLQRRAELEQEMYGDLVFLDCVENMNDGKTYEYFKWVARLPVGERPRFTLKSDSDTFLILPNVLHTLSSLSCSNLHYWGTSWGACLSTCYPYYHRGLAYGLSWPLVAWLASAKLEQWQTVWMEDARTGSWLRNLPPEAGGLGVTDLGTRAGDWDGLTIPWNTETVALHAMKTPGHYAKAAGAIMRIWEEEGREWRWPPRVDLGE